MYSINQTPNRATLAAAESVSNLTPANVTHSADLWPLCALRSWPFFCPTAPVFCSEDETQLVKTLFNGYNKVVRPVNHFSEPVVVTVGLQLIQLISVVGNANCSTFAPPSKANTNSSIHKHSWLSVCLLLKVDNWLKTDQQQRNKNHQGAT